MYLDGQGWCFLGNPRIFFYLFFLLHNQDHLHLAPSSQVFVASTGPIVQEVRSLGDLLKQFLFSVFPFVNFTSSFIICTSTMENMLKVQLTTVYSFGEIYSLLKGTPYSIVVIWHEGITVIACGKMPAGFVPSPPQTPQ